MRVCSKLVDEVAGPLFGHEIGKANGSGAKIACGGHW
jgi:hypothetical protein